jgi:hypothetical protein
MRRVVAVMASVIVALAVAAGIFVLGSPNEERSRRLDERRVIDLTAIATAADLYWTRHGSLPASLDDLRREPGTGVTLEDPEGGAEYEYRSLDTNTYEVCARFTGSSQPGTVTETGGFWSHGAGRQCFAREAREVR